MRTKTGMKGRVVLKKAKEAVSKMQWNVFRYDINKKEICVWNIFEHYNFAEEVAAHLKKCDTKEAFEKELRSSLMYYFWSKAEYEVIVSDWPHTDSSEVKVDIYQQVMNNWDIFLDYIWEARR